LESRAERYAFKPGRLSSHGRILQLAARWPRTCRILDVGTAGGYLGRELRRLGFDDIVGVERDPQRSAEAAQWYREHYTADVERQSLPAHLTGFDVVICGDVLEHLREPRDLLLALKPLLKQDGRLVVSVPNVANWTVRLSLLGGRFTYADRGLLDRTHLRFYTQRTARQLLESAGFAVESCDPTPIPFEHALAGFVPASAARAIEAGYFLLAAAWKTMFAYQFVFVARPA